MKPMVALLVLLKVSFVVTWAWISRATTAWFNQNHRSVFAGEATAISMGMPQARGSDFRSKLHEGTQLNGSIQLMDGHSDHRFERGQFRQGASIDAIGLKEISGGLHTSMLIAVNVGLAFGDMEGIRGGDFVEVAVTVKKEVLRLCDRRLQRILATQSVQTSPGFN